MSIIELGRESGSKIVLDFTDVDIVDVRYNINEPLSLDESNEVSKLIQLIDGKDFSEILLNTVHPLDMKPRIEDKLYFLDVAHGSLVLVENSLFFISNDTKFELRNYSESKIESNLGTTMILEEMYVNVGEYKLPYVFDEVYLDEIEFPRITKSLPTTPLRKTGESLLSNKFINEEGNLYIFTEEPDSVYTMYMDHNSMYIDNVIQVLSLLYLGKQKDLTIMLK